MNTTDYADAQPSPAAGASTAQQRFRLGHIVLTEAAAEVMSQVDITTDQLLNRHVMGDWGDLCSSDKQALKEQWRLMSSYHLPNGEKVWIITESDRSVTTLLLPSDY